MTEQKRIFHNFLKTSSQVSRHISSCFSVMTIELSLSSSQTCISLFLNYSRREISCFSWTWRIKAASNILPLIPCEDFDRRSCWHFYSWDLLWRQQRCFVITDECAGRCTFVGMDERQRWRRAAETNNTRDTSQLSSGFCYSTLYHSYWKHFFLHAINEIMHSEEPRWRKW